MNFAESYLGQLRAVVGSRPLIAVGARMLIENEAGQFLIIRRADDGLWGLPGGAMELGESVLDAALREAREETGFDVQDITPFGLSSDPRNERHVYPNGDIVQNVSLLVHGRLGTTQPKARDDEVSTIAFSNVAQIDPATFAASEYPTFAYWDQYRRTGTFVVT